MADLYKSEIRASTIRNLLEKSRKQNFDKFLVRLRLEKLRLFAGATISFDFPVVALVGPNGGGKTTVLGACGCIYSDQIQNKVFLKSLVGDEEAPRWEIAFEVIDRSKNQSGSITGDIRYDGTAWTKPRAPLRDVAFLSLMRTLPLSENPQFHLRGHLTGRRKSQKNKRIEIVTTEQSEEISNRIRSEGEKVLGKSLSEYRFYVATSTTTRTIQTKEKRRPEWVVLGDGRRARVEDDSRLVEKQVVHSIRASFATGKNRLGIFSELNFGAGESSVLRIIADIESLPDGSLILIDELENGLHPVAAQRLVEYLIDVADRKRLQAIFTTHSDYALAPLPSEAIWACLDGRVQQGKLTIEALRAVTGRVDQRLAIFVEDDFAKHWLEAILREVLGAPAQEVGIYAIGGDGSAVKTHAAHIENPSVDFHSICYLDGDSRQKDDANKAIFRLPGENPELTVFNSVKENLASCLAILTLSCQRPLGSQEQVKAAIESVAQTNRDPHLLFTQIGALIGFVPEGIVRGAFLSVWVQENLELSRQVAKPIQVAIG